MISRSALLLTAIAVAAPGPTTAIAETSTGGAFFDRFTGIDGSRWFVSNGWSNGPHQNCTWSEANVKVDNSLELLLTNEPGKDRPFTCGELQSKAEYGYGTFEVRMRAAAAPGVVTAFFTFVGPQSKKGAAHNEIDFEFLGKDRNGAFVSYFVGGPPANSQTARLDFDATAAANDFAFEWAPDSIRWFANGKLIREVKKGPGQPLPDQPQKIILSIWNGTGWDQEAWLGRFEYPGKPLVGSFEHVAFTPLGAACQFPTSIVCVREGGSPATR